MSYQQIKALREKRLAIGTEMRSIVDAADKDSCRRLTVEERSRIDKMTLEVSEIDQDIDRLEKVVDIESKLAAVPKNDVREMGNVLEEEGLIADPSKLRNSPAVKAFRQFLRFGREALSAEQRQLLRRPADINLAQTTNNGPGGGDLVPTGFMYDLVEAEKAWGKFLDEVDPIRTATGQPLPWPTDNDTNNQATILGQNTQVTENDVAFGQPVTLSAYILTTGSVLVPEALMQDSAFDIDGLITRIFGKRFGRGKNAYFTAGTGPTNGQPYGIVPATVATGNTIIAGGGATSGSTTSFAYGDMLNVLHAVDPAYRDLPSAKFMMNDGALKVARLIKDTTGRPLWMPGYYAGFGSTFPDTIMGKPYVINQAMSAPAAGVPSMLFGDLKSYKARQVVPEGSQDGVILKRLVERYADYMQIGFIGFQRFDGNLLDAGTHPIAALVQSNS